MNILELLDSFKPSSRHAPAATYMGKLEQQASIMLIPTIIVASFIWLPYIELDIKLHPELPQLIFFRLAATAAAMVTLGLSFLPFFKKRRYALLVGICLFIETAAGVILGLVKADPVYMGGYSLMFVILPLLPLKKEHTLMILACSCTAFGLVGWMSEMTFHLMDQRYGGYDFISALIVSVTATFMMETIRRRNYSNHKSLNQAHEDLQETMLELQLVNEELSRTSIDLSRANEELSSANKLKKELMDMAAHDLKDPLQVIHLYTDSLKYSLAEDDEKARDKLRRINKAADKMENLITHLLEVAVIQSGTLQLKKSRVDIGKLLATSVNNNRYFSERKNQTIQLDTQEGCILQADRDRLEQVLDNLISNAVKFSPPEKTIWVDSQCTASQVTVRVRDEGPGLTEEDKKKLFHRFQKLSARPTAGESSTGLGLCITKELVTLHGGDIHVESIPGEGATFVVEFPNL